MTDRTDLVLVALTFPGCSIYLCILGNRLVQSDVLYLGSPSPTQNRNHFRPKESPMPEDERAKSFWRQRTYQNHQGFTWVGLNKKLCHSLWQFGWRDNESILYFQTKIIGWGNTLASASLKVGMRGLVLLRSFQNLGYSAENWFTFCSLKCGIFCLHCLTTTSCRIWLQHGSILI